MAREGGGGGGGAGLTGGGSQPLPTTGMLPARFLLMAAHLVVCITAFFNKARLRAPRSRRRP